LFIGVLFGALVSIAARQLFSLYAADESGIGNMVTTLYSVTEWTAYQLHSLTGHEWPPGGGHMLAWRPTSLIVTTNALLCGLVGVLVGGLLRLRISTNEAV
jgi:hypothetical protein